MLFQLLLSNPIAFIVLAGALVMAITVHEFAHAWMANRLGDPTPRLQGRLTLNPLAHLDPLGTLLIFFIGFGWGKPVQFDPFNLENPRRDAAIISFAGPLSNIIIVTVLSLLYRVAGPLMPFSPFLIIIPLLIRLNLSLAIFNLIPIHPLDGGKILIGLLPRAEAHQVDIFLRRYGTILLLLIIFPFMGASIVSMIVSPIIDFLMRVYLPSSIV
jgi:Zn-dependent protease